MTRKQSEMTDEQRERQREKARRWYAANREVTIERARRRYAENREQCLDEQRRGREGKPRRMCACGHAIMVARARTCGRDVCPAVIAGHERRNQAIEEKRKRDRERAKRARGNRPAWAGECIACGAAISGHKRKYCAAACYPCKQKKPRASRTKKGAAEKRERDRKYWAAREDKRLEKQIRYAARRSGVKEAFIPAVIAAAKVIRSANRIDPSLRKKPPETAEQRLQRERQLRAAMPAAQRESEQKMKREYQRRRYHNLTDAQRKDRSNQLMAREREKIDRMTEEQRQQYIERRREYRRQWYANMSEEQRQRQKEADRQRRATAEQRQHIAETKRRRVASMTDEQQIERRRKRREYKRRWQAANPEKYRESRRRQDRAKRAKIRAAKQIEAEQC